MESLDFRVSGELREILKKANQVAKDNGDKEITIELVTYLILNEYVNEGATESGLITEVLQDYSKEDRLKIVDACSKAYVIRSSKVKTSLSSHSDSYSFDEYMEDSISKSRISRKLRKEILGLQKDKPADIITTEDLLVWGILFQENVLVTTLNEDFEFNKEKFLAQEMADAMFSGVIKTKRIESESPVEVKDEEEKPKEENQPKDKSEDEDKFEKTAMSGSISVKKRDPNSKTPVLDQYGLDMTRKAGEGGYDPLVGREKEISQVIEILCCRKKNNAALLGEAGTGKTAIVEGLAQKIAKGDVPAELKGKRIFSISTTDLQAGTIYRGQLEERVQELCNEVRDNDDVIVYIDEFHQAVSEGSSNIAQMLKPSLARGEMNMIISTTTREYRRYIEKDAALKRRFEPVQIEEPTLEETKAILKGIAPQYSKFHHVKITDEVIKACAEWSGQYITDRQFPDKAIGIMDMSSSLTKLENPLDYKKREELQEKIDEMNKEVDALVEDAELEKASGIRDERIKVEKELVKLIEKQEKDVKSWPEVTVENVSKVISKISGVPVDKIRSSSMKKLKEMKDQLASKVIGQEEGVSELVTALQRNILGLRDPNKPIASFLLVGPTGVGKTMVSKVLASEFFGSEKSLVTIACSEYMQDWAESKLLGSAPGYVGFSDSEPRLYILKRKPFCVLLIDEIEKSSSNLYNIWLNMLEEGEVTLSSGEKVSCRDCIIIFTGNVGTKSLELKSTDIGFGSVSKEDRAKKDKATVMKEVQKEFRPEFLNRLSKIIVFDSLGKKELEKIFDLELAKLQERLTDYKVTVSKKLKSWIIDKTEPKYGARSLQRLIIEYIEQELCKELLETDTESMKKPVKVKFDLEDEGKVKVMIPVPTPKTKPEETTVSVTHD
jgi:ATP-dependent Clp protease ATP-binding subunit ClpC